MKTIVWTLISVTALALVGACLFVYSGVFNVAATDPHSSPVFSVLEFTRIRSIKAHAVGILPPAGFDDHSRIVMAAGHFAAHCAVCHAAPGARRGAIAQGMYPQPPDLTDVARRFTPGELFWILKNGIKMSGMPSMADDGDEMLWSTVAFLEKLPGMSDDDYNDLWIASQSRGGGAEGGMNMPGAEMDRAHTEPRP